MVVSGWPILAAVKGVVIVQWTASEETCNKTDVLRKARSSASSISGRKLSNP